MSDLLDWAPPRWPDAAVLEGRYARLEVLDADRHGADLHAANIVSDAIWDYLPYGPFGAEADYVAWVREATAGRDPRFHAICDLDAGRWGGVASYLRIKPESGSIDAPATPDS